MGPNFHYLTINTLLQEKKQQHCSDSLSSWVSESSLRVTHKALFTSVTGMVLFLHKTPGWLNDSMTKVSRWLLTSHHRNRQQLPRGQTGRCVRHLDTCCSLALCTSLVFTSHFSSGDLSCPWGAVRRQQLSLKQCSATFRLYTGIMKGLEVDDFDWRSGAGMTGWNDSKGHCMQMAYGWKRGAISCPALSCVLMLIRKWQSFGWVVLK